MAKSFSSLNTKLGLHDFLTFGKYKGCRIDSIRDMDIEYLQYIKHNKIVTFDQSVLDSMANKYAADGVDVRYTSTVYADSFDYINGHDMSLVGYELDDVPF